MFSLWICALNNGFLIDCGSFCNFVPSLQVLVLVAIVLLADARPQGSKEATIVRYENENIGVDGYKFAYETSDGIQREEEGELKNAGTDDEAIAVRGSFTWKDEATGQVYTVTFVADENGYQPKTEIKRK